MKAAPPALVPDSDAETDAVIREARRRQRRRQRLIGVAVMLLAGAAGITVSQMGPGGQPPVHRGLRPGAGPQPRIEPASAQWTATVRARVPIPVSQEGGMAVLGSTAWVAEWDNGLVVRVDLAARRVTKVLHVGGALRGGPISIAAGAGSVWILNFSTARLLRIDPVTGTVTNRIQIPGGATAAAYGDGFAWVTGPSHGPEGMRLYKIDPARNVIVQSRSILPVSVTALDCPVFPGPQGLWLACARDGGITLIDPASLKPREASPAINSTGYEDELIAPGQHVVWVLTAAGLAQVDPATARITAITKINWDTGLLPFQESAFAVDRAGRVWIANSALDVLAPGSRAVRQVAHTAGLGIGIINVVTAGAHLWADTGPALVELDVHHAAAKS